MKFVAKDLLSHALPDYFSERILLRLKLLVSGVLWFVAFPHFAEKYVLNKKPHNGIVDPATGKRTQSRAITIKAGTTRIIQKRETVTIRLPARPRSIDASSSDHPTTKGVKGNSHHHNSKEESRQQPQPPMKEERSGILVCIAALGCLASSVTIILGSSHNTFVGRGIFEAPLFTAEECQSILNRSYAAAARNLVDRPENVTELLLQEPAGWQKSRHSSYPTIDLNLVTDSYSKEDRDYVASLLDQRLTPLLESIFGIPAKAIRANDLFVVRYTADTRSFLAKHTDDSDISFNVLLNEDFEGGGTQFWNRFAAEPFVKVQPHRAGQVLMHSALVEHEGLPVTRGIRLILVGFLAVDHVIVKGSTTTGMSWFASWLSLPFLNVKFKDAYMAAHLRLEKRTAGESKEERWTDHKLVRSLFQDIVLLVQTLGDVLCNHHHYNLVQPEHHDAYLQRMSQSQPVDLNNKVAWFDGQQIRKDLGGVITSQWNSRRDDVDKFKDL